MLADCLRLKPFQIKAAFSIYYSLHVSQRAKQLQHAAESLGVDEMTA